MHGFYRWYRFLFFGWRVETLTMSIQTNHIEQWTTEYDQGGIPSSTRTTPSGCVVHAVGEFGRRQIPLKHAVDIGCGKGRNSLYLAGLGVDVTAMDFTPNAIHALEDKAREDKLSQKIRALVQDVTEPWPVASASMDFAIDAFCFKHITPREARLQYRTELLRVLKTHGHYLLSFASIGDGYYGRYIIDKCEVNGEEEHVVVDPENGIQSVLYTREGVLNFFHPELEVIDELQNNKPSMMHGVVYERQTYALLFQRRLRAN
jgi:SAM-dependent methyltransferase